MIEILDTQLLLTAKAIAVGLNDPELANHLLAGRGVVRLN